MSNNNIYDRRHFRSKASTQLYWHWLCPTGIPDGGNDGCGVGLGTVGAGVEEGTAIQTMK